MLLDVYRQTVWQEMEKLIPSITAKQDDDSDYIKNAFDRLRTTLGQRLKDRDYQQAALDGASMANRVNQAYHVELINRVRGVNPIMVEPWLDESMKSFIRENSSLIKTIPTEGLSDIEQMVYRESRRGLSPKDMRAKIRDEFDVSEGRARVLARDQIGKFNANLTEKRQTNLGITEYTWRTSKDGRVRDRHEHLEGTKHKWSEPPITVTTGKRAGERNHPGEDIQCRCYAEPDIDHLL